MKQETILEGAEIISRIEAVQKTKALIEIVSKVDMSNHSNGTIITINPFLEPASANFHNAACPNDLKEQIKEETLRFLQRCKRHCDDLEFKLKQELEDLA